ncbi:MAG: S1 RNA-binding domain-containing protein [bacterium]|nr:S1 RNA-binding domain-containing protein [bacterium]MDD7616644.1 S1 RNA-binding domain-containing protein [bacterium]MDY4158687.1 S1 RNA-binding domain-containing protein [Candidatus Onthovivens sp.]MDY5668152.1 S1 RNA-binding domain-containing protein [Candidatus Onthovivens sp.]
MFQNKVYEEGQIIEGIITSIKKYGAFFSFEGGYIGLLHISEISSNFVNNIHNFFKIGDTVRVVVKKVDNSTKFLSVSLKDLPIEENPYKDILPSKKVTSYLKEIDFSKLEKQLPLMIKKELEKEEKL